jgi:hypothetical protein
MEFLKTDEIKKCTENCASCTEKCASCTVFYAKAHIFLCKRDLKAGIGDQGSGVRCQGSGIRCPQLNPLRSSSSKNLTPMKQIKRFHWARGAPKTGSSLGFDKQGSAREPEGSPPQGSADKKSEIRFFSLRSEYARVLYGCVL